jgi:dihydrofolate reductase
MVSLIVAMNSQNIIGVDGGLPWHLPEDMKFFKHVTEDKTVIMGRATWDSLPKKFRPLPNRQNIVVSGSMIKEGIPLQPLKKGIDPDLVVSNIDRALEWSMYDPVFIGGEGIYRAALEHVTDMFVTHVKNVFIDEREYGHVAKFPSKEIDWPNWFAVDITHYPTHVSCHYRREV